MRILHVTDTHLGRRCRVRGGPAGWSVADDHLAAFEAALQPALQGEVDAVVHSGDLFDRSRPPSRAVHAAVRVICEVARRVPVALMPGNHDRRGLLRHLPVRVAGLTIVDTPTRVRLGDAALALVPFRRTAEGWAHAARVASAGGVDLLVAHQAFDGHRVPGFTFRVGMQRDTIGPQHLPPGVHHVLCGHIHPRQAVRCGEAQVVCPGSTERTAFSERHQTKGVAVWELGRGATWQFVDLKTRSRVVVQTRDHLAQVAPGSLVRLTDPGIEETEVLALGGWLVGRPRDVPTVKRAAPQPSQLLLWG